MEYKDAFILAQKHTRSTSKQINSNWLVNNGYTRVRKQIDNVRKTYYIADQNTATK